MQGVLSYITILLKKLLQAEKQKKVMVFFVAKQTTNICTFSLDIRGQKKVIMLVKSIATSKVVVVVL